MSRVEAASSIVDIVVTGGAASLVLGPLGAAVGRRLRGPLGRLLGAAGGGRGHVDVGEGGELELGAALVEVFLEADAGPAGVGRSCLVLTSSISMVSQCSAPCDNRIGVALNNYHGLDIYLLADSPHSTHGTAFV